MKSTHQKVIDSKNTEILPKNYKGISVTIGLSLLLHIIFLVKVGLPFNKYDPLRNAPLEVKIISNSFQDNSVAKKTSIPDAAETNSLAAKLQEKSAPKIALAIQKSQTTINNEFIKEPLTSIQEPNLKETSLESSQATTITEADQLIPANEVNLSFTIVSVYDGKILGKAQQHFTSDGRNTYQLSITNKSSDAIDSSTSKYSDETWSYQVSGRVFGNRLSPSLYEIKGSLAERLFLLSRETNSGTAVLDTPTSGRMPDGILDRQSLIYQFMYRPPIGNDTQIALSDGAKNSTYKVHVVAIEIVDSEQFGKLQIVHILMSNVDSSETFELWLAPTIKYLPIKVRYTSTQNNIIDLLVSNLSFK